MLPDVVMVGNRGMYVLVIIGVCVSSCGCGGGSGWGGWGGGRGCGVVGEWLGGGRHMDANSYVHAVVQMN